jgi:hypothetical protein
MKKLLLLAVVAGFTFGFTACGPSEEERKKDSTDVANQVQKDADSLMNLMNIGGGSDSSSTPAPGDSAK